MIAAGTRRLRAEAWVLLFPVRIDALADAAISALLTEQKLKELRQAAIGIRTVRRMSYLAGALTFSVAAIVTGWTAAEKGLSLAAALNLAPQVILAVYACSLEKAVASLLHGIAAVDSSGEPMVAAARGEENLIHGR